MFIHSIRATHDRGTERFSPCTWAVDQLLTRHQEHHSQVCTGLQITFSGLEIAMTEIEPFSRWEMDPSAQVKTTVLRKCLKLHEYTKNQ